MCLGICGQGTVCSTDFKCVVATSGGLLGTCDNPIPLLESESTFLGKHTIHGNTNKGINLLAPTCNTLSDAKELIYSLTVPTGSYQFVGAMITLSGDGIEFDTVLEIYEEYCGFKNASISCTDDSTPPGATGSRAEVKLVPGKTYFIHVDGYSASYVGPFKIQADFFVNCIPQCDGNFCLDNGCGTACGDCTSGDVCSTITAKCIPNNCKPDCSGKTCGSDGCDGTCGTCSKGYCSFDILETGDYVNLGVCIETPVCDNYNPICKPSCGAKEFCGTDCKCHSTNERLADMVVSLSELSMKWEKILETSCSYVEGCSPNIGNRKLIRFTVRSMNYGQSDLRIPQPKELPAYFQFSPCHQHWHFKGYARYTLYDYYNHIVRDGGKESYCLEDSGPIFQAPWVECSPYFDCGFQGIQRGWTDEYGSVLDCQWLDVTDVPDGNYRLEININQNERFQEISNENNYDYVFLKIKGDDLTLINSLPSSSTSTLVLLPLSIFVLFLFLNLL
eukprot:TRINITY_DN7196_c0_g3_i1.p1 TRINITY_DN7196_c0_g3~~TRINITY_DN7196_c0_g3_i1.p1  ORF type:complete len:504 (-),score=70.72 TRINITY_DN7196_c0_g3_i1:265-1776(-)